jgi:SAM-dependent methyltransferase
MPAVEPSEYDAMRRAEDRHWWYLGMARITAGLLAALYPGRSDLSILDAGCGTGGALAYLAPFGRVTAIDLSPLALGYCRRRRLARLAQASVGQLPFAAGAFDLVTSFDVLYHRAVGDWRPALDELARVLRPGGRLLLRLPAYDWLRGRHDRVIHTAHRFTAGELAGALRAGGLEVEKVSYANTLLFPLALARRLLERPGGPAAGSDLREVPEWQNRLFGRALAWEAGWLPRHDLPYGLTVLAIGRRPGPIEAR